MAGAKPPRRIDVFGDETRDRGEFDVLGTLFVRHQHAELFRERIAEYRSAPEIRYPWEMKWEKIGGSRPSPLYMKVIDDVMAMIRSNRARYRCLVIERRLVRHLERGKENRAESVSKSWKLLLGVRPRPHCKYHVRLDKKAVKTEGLLSKLGWTLNRAAINNHGFTYDAFPDVRMQDSKEEDLLQVTDLITGAIGYHWGGWHLKDDCGEAKCLVAGRIAQLLGRKDLTVEGWVWGDKFNIWRYRPSLDVQNRARRSL
jgi:Protein of unknown function (DUF3800)